jgi:REP element-mobilizing transposase RayT
MHSDPIGYFITWTCYGTWMPGDERGWEKWHRGYQVPQPRLADWCRQQMVDSAVFLTEIQRQCVNTTVANHCRIRNWHLHAVNCRSNHCHVVVTARNYDGEVVRDQLKSWCKRKLKDEMRTHCRDAAAIREHWWAKNGSIRYVFDDDSLAAAIQYTLDAQDAGGSHASDP